MTLAHGTDRLDVLRLPYTISAILPQNARSRRVAERSGARAAGQMQVVGLTWDRYLWPLATAGETQLQRSEPIPEIWGPAMYDYVIVGAGSAGLE
jgi:RimJ/RimL family protein N-acetyltransferase